MVSGGPKQTQVIYIFVVPYQMLHAELISLLITALVLLCSAISLMRICWKNTNGKLILYTLKCWLILLPNCNHWPKILII